MKTREEVALAVTAAFLQVKSFRAESPLAELDLVVFRSPDGNVHVGPLTVVSLDERTALVHGFMNGAELPVTVRVMRRELVRTRDLRGFVERHLGGEPSPHSNERHEDPSRPAGGKDKKTRTDN